MAEFQVVAKELERICNTYHAVSGKCGTDECPLYYEDLCYAQAMIHVHGDDACKLEKVVMSWAAENPEPVYPTWKDYFTMLYGQDYGLYGDKKLSLSHLCSEQIPPKVAVKLGLDPT